MGNQFEKRDRIGQNEMMASDTSYEKTLNIDELASQFETELSKGAVSRVEDFIQSQTLVSEGPLLSELVKREAAYRFSHGDSITFEEYLSRFPAHEKEVREAVAGCAQATAGITDETVVSASETEPEPQEREEPPVFGPGMILGDYRLISLLGEGGMGMVFRAHQVSVDRDVAVKIIRPERLALMSERKRTVIKGRFEAEARAAGRVTHENLLPVYEFGEVNGVHFFSMPLVDGESLSDMITDGPIDLRAAADYIRQAARGMHAAHRRGVLHRDIKPANIMVETQTGRAIVADFGLAKVLEDDAELTRAGEVFGTPSYMPPEQAKDAGEVTTAGDIYSLGAVLYRMITGVRPFRGGTSMAILKAVIEKEPEDPRMHNPAITRDLTAICLKCLEKNPAARYESAADLEADLDAFLAGKPVAARPVSFWQKKWRWCKRNPLVAGMTALAGVAVMAAIGAFAYSYVTTSEALEDVKTAKAETESQFRETRRVVDEFFVRITEDTLLDQPSLQPLRKDLLERAEKYYTEFLDRVGDDSELRVEAANAVFRLAKIYELTGDDRAVTFYRRAARNQLSLMEDFPDSNERKAEYALTLTWLGNLEFRRGAIKGDTHDRAHKTWEKLRKRDPEHIEYARQYANSLMNRGIVREQAGKKTKALELYNQAQKVREELLKRKDVDWKVRRDYARGEFNLGRYVEFESKLSLAVEHYRAAGKMFAAIHKQRQHDHDIAYLLARSHHAEADSLAGLDRFDPSQRAYAVGFKIADELVYWNPHVEKYRLLLCGIAWNRAVRLHTPGIDRDIAYTLFLRVAKELERIPEERRPRWARDPKAKYQLMPANVLHYQALTALEAEKYSLMLRYLYDREKYLDQLLARKDLPREIRSEGQKWLKETRSAIKTAQRKAADL